jgi:hypothetical protein
MLYLATASGPAARAAIAAGRLGQMVTPDTGNRIVEGARWVLDNGCFGARWTPQRWSAVLDRHMATPGCLFAVVPDVVANAAATEDLWARLAPILTESGMSTTGRRRPARRRAGGARRSGWRRSRRPLKRRGLCSLPKAARLGVCCQFPSHRVTSTSSRTSPATSDSPAREPTEEPDRRGKRRTVPHDYCRSTPSDLQSDRHAGTCTDAPESLQAEE